MATIDARGKACPIPVILAKKEVEKGVDEIVLLVDNRTAVENLARFGNSAGYVASERPAEGGFEVRLTNREIESGALTADGIDAASVGECRIMDFPASWAVFIGRAGIGEGDPELGASLLKMYLYTLCQSSDLPSYILLMNGGVRAAAELEQTVGHLQELEGKGVKVLVCGTCLNFLGLEKTLQAGTVSNMYEITAAMAAVDKVVTL